MQGEVSLRFIKCLEYLKSTGKIPSIRQFAISINVHPQCISDITTGKREVNSDILFKTIEKYKVNPLFIYTGNGSCAIDELCVNSRIEDPILTIVTDKAGNEKIVYVPVSAEAGYGNQLHDPIFMQELPTFNLPGSKYENGTHRCFDISRDSMEPTLYNGDKVVCSFVEPESWLNGLRDNHVYVIISKEGVVIKRLINNLKINGTLILISDNNYYKPFEVELKDISEIWEVSVRISPFMPAPNNIRKGLHDEINLLKMTISDQSKMIRSLNETVEKLLKFNRTSPVR